MNPKVAQPLSSSKNTGLRRASSGRVVIMSPNPAIIRRWTAGLQKEGWKVKSLFDPEKMPEACSTFSDCLLLVDAKNFLRKETLDIRPICKCPAPACRLPLVVFSENGRASKDFILRMLEMGAEDFISSNIDLEFLSAKLKSLFHRCRPTASPERPVRWSPSKRIKLDQDKRIVWMRNGNGRFRQTPPLGSTELKLLSLFLNFPGRSLSRPFILEKIWGEKADSLNSDIISKYIQKLRRKLKPHGSAIRTQYGKGYVFIEKD